LRAFAPFPVVALASDDVPAQFGGDLARHPQRRWSISNFRHFAAYYTPAQDSALYRFGSAWIGYDVPTTAMSLL
jgi:hypothetical protein